MSKGQFARAAVVLAATVAVPVIAATPALAYPPGTDPVVTTAAGGYTTGDPIAATISNVAPDCTINFVVTNGSGASTTVTATSGKDGSAAANIPGQTTAGNYTITAQGVASATNPDCASAAASTTVVVAGKGGNPGSSATPTPTNGASTTASGGGFLDTISTFMSENQRIRNAAIIALLAFGGLWLAMAWRRRHAAEAAEAGVPPKH